MNKSVRKITDGAMMVAIIGVILVINRQFAGLFEEMFLFLFPLPMVFYATKYGRKDSWLILVAIILLTVVLGTPQTIFYVASEAFLGMMYGAGVHDDIDGKKLLIMSMVIGVAVNIISTVIYAEFFGYNLTAEINEYQEIITTTLAEAGMQFNAAVDLRQFITTIVIVSVILTGVLQGIVTHLLSKILLKRLGFKMPKSTPLVLYYPKKWTGYAGIVGLVAYYYTLYRPIANTTVSSILQGLGLCGTIYLCFMGAVALVVRAALRNPKSAGFQVIIAFFLTMFFMLPMAAMGFLYITTEWHSKMMKGALHATKNE